MKAKPKVRWVEVHALHWHEENASPETLRARNGRALAVVAAFKKCGKALRVVPSGWGNGISFQVRIAA